MRNSLIIAAVLFLTYDFFLEYGPKPVQEKMQSQWQDNRYSIEKYFRDSKTAPPQHKVVFVGSSLTKRLDFDEESECVYNLSLGGDSALTGLSAVARSVGKPRLVFIEINIPEHANNQELVEKASGFLPQLSAAFHIENMPINLAISFLYPAKKDKPAKEVSESVRQNALAQGVQSFKVPLPSDTLKNNMAEINRLVGYLESKGTTVVFFEIPIHADLEFSTRAMQVRNAFSSNFQNYQLISFTELVGGGTMKTVDGVHLSDDDAKIVVKNMKVHFSDVCSSRMESGKIGQH